MISAQLWLRLLPVIGLLQCCMCSRLYSKDYIKVPINYQDTESSRYDNEETEYDIVDQKLRMWGEEDHVTHLFQPKVTPGPDREGLNPRFATISSRTVIPDQSELDQVDGDALKRGHEEIIVDKDDETLTEVIEDDVPPGSIPPVAKTKSPVLPSLSVRNTNKLHDLTNTTSHSTQHTILSGEKTKHSFNNSKNELPNTLFASRKQGGNFIENSTNLLHASNSLQGQHFAANSTGKTNFLHQKNTLHTAQIVQNSSSNSQRDKSTSMPNISRDTSKVDSVGHELQNLSQNFNSFQDERLTTQVQSTGLKTAKNSATNNSLNQDSSNVKPVNSTQSSYTEVYNESLPSLGNRPIGNTAIKNNASNLTERQNNKIETLTPTDVMSADLPEVVNTTNNNISFKGIEKGQNISEKKSSFNNNTTDVISIIIPEQSQDTAKEQGLKNNITGKMAHTNTSDIGQAGLFHTDATEDLVSSDITTSERNNSLPILGSVTSETKQETVEKRNKKLDVLLVSDKDRATELQEQQKMQNFSPNTGNGSRTVPSTDVRRTKIIHRKTSTSSTPHKRSKGSRKIQSFLTAVKEMFKEPETAQDILSWETWGPCSRTCGVGAVRTRQRKCGRLVARDFDVACPEPREQSQKCPIVSCLAKSHQKSLRQSKKTGKVETHPSHRPVADNDQKNVNQLFGKHQDSPRAQTNSAVDKFPGTVDDVNQDGDDGDQTENDEIPTEHSEDRPEGYDETSEYTSNVASIQTANQKRYLYTVWGSWSACTRTCGQRAYAFRKRYCINAVTGEIKRHCQRPTILAKKCVLTPCPVDGGLSDWSKWSSCSGTCGIMERHRSCTNPKPAYGGRECFKLPVQMRLCGSCTEDKVTAVQNLASYSPKVLCGLDPCQRVGCLEDKGAICVTDFECNPAFFNDDGRVLKGCRDSKQLFLRPLAQKKCSFNPCSFAKCDVDGAKCLVDTKCRPFFVNEVGKRVNCKGSNVLQISSELICGFNPCKIATCTVDPEAKCVTDYRCNAIFLNAAGQRISGCTEDEMEAVERISTEKPTAAQQSTENPSARDKTPLQHFYPYLLHKLQKYREESSVKKTIENNIDKTKNKLKDITLLEDILARRLNHSTTLNSENSTNSGNFEDEHPDEFDQHLTTSPKILGKESAKALDIKLLELVLQGRLHPNNATDSENTTNKTNVKSEKDFQNLRHDNDNANNSNAVVENPKKKSESANIGITSDNTVTLKTVHQSNSETTEIVDSPSPASEPLSTDVLDKPLAFTNKNSVAPNEKPFQMKMSTDKMIETDSNATKTFVTQERNESKTSPQEQWKKWADVDRFILDEFNRKKKMEEPGTATLGLSGVDKPEGKIPMNTNEATGLMGNYNGKNEVNSKDIEQSDYDNNNNSNTNNNNINYYYNSSNNNNYINNNSNSSRNGGNNNNQNNTVVAKPSNNNMLSNTQRNNLKNSTTDISGTVVKNNEMNEIVDNNLTTTATANNNNNNDNNNNSGKVNNNNISGKINNDNNNNLNSDYNNNVLNTTINPQTPKTPPTIISTTSNTIPPSQNITPHYNLGLAKVLFIKNVNKTGPLDTKLGTQSKPQVPKVSSDKKHGDNQNDGNLDMLWEHYLADMKNMNGGSMLHDDTGKMINGNSQFDLNKSGDYDSSASDLKFKSGKIDDSKMVSMHKGVMTVAETGKSGMLGDGIPVIHSGDPDLVISPYDEDVASNAFEKEQSENPEGIPSNAELNRMLNTVPATKLTNGNQGSNILPQKAQTQHANYVRPQTTQGEHKRPLVSASQRLLPVAQQEKPVNQVTNKPVNQITDSRSQADLINKLVFKAVQKEIAKLKIDGILQDALKNTKSKQHERLDETSIKEEQNMQGHKIGVTQRPRGNPRYKELSVKLEEQDNNEQLGLTERPSLPSLKQGRHDMGINKKLRADQGYKGVFVKQGRQDKTGRLGVTERPSGVFVMKAKQDKTGHLGITRKPDNQAYKGIPISTTVPIFHDEKGSHSYHKQEGDSLDSDHHGGDGEASDHEGSDAVDSDHQGGDAVDSDHQGGDGEVSHHQGGETEKDSDQVSDPEGLRELDDFLKSDDSEDNIEKTTAKPEQTTNTPEENDSGHKTTESSDEYTVTLAPWKEGDLNGHVGEQRINEVNEQEHQDQAREPENKESYSPSLVNEIKELGLDEYYIKDGFQTPRVPKHRKVDNGQVRQVLKSHHWEEDKDNDDNYGRHTDHPVRYGKKFHLAQIEMLPDANGHSALRQHNSNGDEIERVPNSYREDDGLARSYTNHKIPKGNSHMGSLTNYFNKLRHYYGKTEGDLLDSGLKAKHRNAMDLGNAIILTAKDDGNSRNYIQDSENFIDDPKLPKIEKQISQKNNLIGNDVLFADDNVSNKNGLMVFRASDDDEGDYRRTLGMRSKHPRFRL